MTTKPIHVAEIIGKWLGGGVEATVMNYYRNIDRNKLQFDFICDEDSTNIPYEEIEKMGGKVILVPPYQKVFKYQKVLKNILKENNYQIVHSHINTLSVFPLMAAKKVGIPVRIAHSHSTTNKKEWKRNLLKTILKQFSKIYPTNYCACSEIAGRYQFGNRIYEQGKVTIIRNAIDLNKYKYNTKIREEVKKELNIPKTKKVIGHIGRFVETKNHDFLIEIFNEIHKKNKDTILVLLGQGPLLEKIKDKCEKLNITDSVMFLGQKEHTYKYYQIFDCLIFPSLYEGLGLVAIEGQCAGLKCICSKNVSKEADLTGNVTYLGLNEDISKWCETTLEILKNETRIDCSIDIRKKGYDIKVESKLLEEYYLNLLKERL